MLSDNKKKAETQYSASNKQLKVEITNFRYERHMFYRNSPTLDQWKSRERLSSQMSQWGREREGGGEADWHGS